MITLLSRRIADFLYEKNAISKEYIEICKYGYEVLLFNLFNALLVLVLGILLDKLLYSVIFFSVFALLRQYCGGYHAKSTIVCTLVYIAVYLFVILTATSRFISDIYTFSTHIMLGIALVVTIFLFAPIENSNKFIAESEKRKYKGISIGLSFFIMAISMIAYHINIHISAIISLTLFVVMLLMLAGLYERKRGERYEKDA